MSKVGAGRSLIRLVARNRRSRDRPGFRCYSLDQALSVLRRARACTPHGIQNRPRELEQLRSDGDGLLCLLYVHRMGLTPPCTCTSRTPLRAVTATRLDASVYSTSAAFVYSCSTSQIRVRLAWLAFPQERASARVVVPSACSTTRGACRSMRPLAAAATTRGDASSMSAASVYSSRCLPSSVYSSHRKGRQNNREKGKIEGARCTGSGLMSMRPLPAAATTRGDASSMSAASVYSCSTSQIRVRLAWLAFPQDRA